MYKLALEIIFNENEFGLIKMGFKEKHGFKRQWRIACEDCRVRIFYHENEEKLIYEFNIIEQDYKYIAKKVYIDHNLYHNFNKGKSHANNYYIIQLLYILDTYIFKNKEGLLLKSREFLNQGMQVDLSSFHGINHWRNVKKIGNFLADTSGADKQVINIFSYIHDAWRHNEWADPEHGIRAKKMIPYLLKNKIININLKQKEQLSNACEFHSLLNAKSNDITIQTCWDADRLDLFRLNMAPNPNLLYTDYAKDERAIAWAKNLN